ncbi:MAG: thermonuclease family protein [Candidatus Thiodiazotropha sp. (ex Dulcina madagascariensis)]|nr:thermonuclease family protein [Candidatus Thiodiazotropha sp. (ex Dulcina madagascariensis)]
MPSGLKRAPYCGAFLLWICFPTLLSPSPAAADACVPCGGEWHEVSSVHDGDTLRLRDGRTVRLIGVNTPELEPRGVTDAQPGAEAARLALERLVKQSGQRVRVCAGAQGRDRYRRHLAHLYDSQGESINQRLLRLGVGYLIAIPPNLKNLTCYAVAEAAAREAGLGVWRQPLQDASRLRGDEAGFHLLRGRIIRVGQSRSGVWLNLDGGLAIRIRWDDWKSFAIEEPDEFLGSLLEVRGWIYRRKGEQRLAVRHPASIRWLDRE